MPTDSEAGARRPQPAWLPGDSCAPRSTSRRHDEVLLGAQLKPVAGFSTQHLKSTAMYAGRDRPAPQVLAEPVARGAFQPRHTATSRQVVARAAAGTAYAQVAQPADSPATARAAPTRAGVA